MLINLKQVEITEAIKQYIANKGIDIASKQVSIIYTAGRKGSGITADLLIEYELIPGYETADPEDEKTTAQVTPFVRAVEATEVVAETPVVEAAVTTKEAPQSLFA